MSKPGWYLYLTMMAGMLGCSGGTLDGVPVTGKVTFKNTPLVGGSVSFYPKDGAGGRPATASIQSDGSYSAAMATSEPGMVPGDYVVTVIALDRPLYEAAKNDDGIVSKVPDRYRSPNTSGLTLTVPDGSGPIVHNIELAD